LRTPLSGCRQGSVTSTTAGNMFFIWYCPRSICCWWHKTSTSWV